DEAIEVLRERRDNIVLEIRGIEREYGEIRVQLEGAIDNIARAKEEMDEIIATYEQVDKTFTFPVDGESKLTRLREALRIGKATINQLNDEVSNAKSAYDMKVGTIQAKKQQYNVQFATDNLYEFTIKIEEIASYLQEKQQTLAEQKEYIETRLHQIKKEQQLIEAADRKLENFKEAHHFHQTNVTAIHLTEREQTDFQYNRMKVVERITEALTNHREALEIEKNNIDHAKRQFRSFCRRNITDRQLQETAIEGMETKETYDEILAYKENMFIRLESANKYARDFTSNNDKEIQAFINNIHNHLLNVTNELKVIPKKTQVKVANQAKDI